VVQHIKHNATNLFYGRGEVFIRKGLEAGFSAKRIEIIWAKNGMLEVYLNVAEFVTGIVRE